MMRTSRALKESTSCPSKAAVSGGRRCLCQGIADKEDDRLPWDYSVLCSACCKRALRQHLERHEQALVDRDAARASCAQRLASLRNETLANENSSEASNLSELQFESQRLRDRKAQLQEQCSSLAVEVAAYAVENEEKKASLNPQADLHRQQLQRLDHSVCDGPMTRAIEEAREQVRMMRFQWALKAFAMHRLDIRAEDGDFVNEDEISGSKQDLLPGESPQSTRRSSLRGKEGRQKQARGIGKIGGLPLPHAGPELYGVLPPQELQSALRLVASITCTVARCLGINLPHPVLLHPTNALNQGDIIHSAVMKQGTRNFPKDYPVTDDSDPTSTTSLLSILKSSLEDSSENIANNDYGQNTGLVPGSGRRHDLEERTNSTAVPPSMDPSLVKRRLQHATSAILAEADWKKASSTNSDASATASSQYALAADTMYQDDFAIALQLLQNNVIVLCIRSGVPVSKLFPAEAVLLNLYALQVFCKDQIRQYLA